MRKVGRMWRLIVVVLLVLTPTLAHSATYYATPSGSNTNCAAATNSSTPIAGAATGAACLSGGDTLVLLDGTYGECLQDVIPAGLNASQPTTVKAEHLRKAILTGPCAACADSLIHIGVRGDAVNSGVIRPYITLDGLFLDMPTDRPCFGVLPQGGQDTGAINGTHDMQILNLEIRGGINTGSVSTFTVGLAQGQNEYGFTIRGNYIHDIGMVNASPTDAAWSYGMYVSGSDNIIEHNEIARTSGYAFHGYSTANNFNNNIFRNNYVHDTGGPLLLACAGQHNQIYNNIVAHTGIGPARNHGGIVLGTNCAGTPADNNVIYNNTIVGVSGAGCERGISLSCPGLVSASNNVVRNNILWQNTPDDSISNGSAGAGSNTLNTNLCSGGSGAGCSVYSDPLFARTIPASDLTAAGIRPEDFQLQNGSPALGAGATVSEVTTDYGGHTRPQPPGTQPDLGSWEMVDVLPQLKQGDSRDRPSTP
jgi:hypothetical protein